LILLLLYHVVPSFTVVLFNNQTFELVSWVDVNGFPNASLPLVLWDDSLTGSNLTGRYVFIQVPTLNVPVYMKPYHIIIENIYLTGAVGVLEYATNGRRIGYRAYGAFDIDYPISVAFVGLDALNYWKQTGGND